jgi:hypothetical protein
LLTPAALAEMREVALGASIWMENKPGGYLGSRFSDGFAMPHVAQLARELERALPQIFGRHSLNIFWGFKILEEDGPQGAEGIKVHADVAAVNVNFWITEDDANKDPNSGGLVVFSKMAPVNMTFDDYNSAGSLEHYGISFETDVKARVPYRSNRAVIFDSSLFHQTDVARFKPGYKNRRVNFTLLYGTLDGVRCGVLPRVSPAHRDAPSVQAVSESW